MPQQSQEGFIGFRTQAAINTYVDPGAVVGVATGAPHDGHFMKIRSGALAGNRELIVPDPEIGGNRDIPDAALGPIAFSGEYEAYNRFEAIGTLLNACLGTTSTGVAGTTWDVDLVGTHTITPIDVAANVPYLSVEEQIGAGWETFNYTDARVNTMHFEGDPDGYVLCNAGFIALTQTASNTPTAAPVFDDSPLSVGAEVTVTWNSVAACAKNFTIDFNNNIEDDDFCLGSSTLQNLTPKRREITAGFSLRDDDSTDFWREAVYGDSAATSPQDGQTVKRELIIDIVSGGFVPGTAVPYSLKFTFPSATITPFEVAPSGDDVLENAFEVQVFRPTATAAVTVELINRYDVIQ